MTPLLAPFALVYGSLVRARNARFDRMAPQRLRWPVVSIGNLSVGGAGKTPLVICLARLLERDGFRPDVLSRGYGRSSKGIHRVDSAGDAEQFGDEPLLLARAAGVPVYVGASRYDAGLLAEAEIAGEGRHVHLLDDGFQHRQLARNLDIVVIHRSDLQGAAAARGTAARAAVFAGASRCDCAAPGGRGARVHAACLCGEGMPLLAHAAHAQYLAALPSARSPSAPLPVRQNFLLHCRRLGLRSWSG